jgi:lipoate-protein ligase A
MLDLRLLNLTLPTPAENLACDEALLDQCDDRGGEGILRFWEPTDHFVVVGYANRVAAEVHEETCRTERVPILRRCSGGGTVLQGPGCLNYSLVLPMDSDARLQSISDTNRLVLERHRVALSKALGQPVLARGFTDLALGPLKFSGNAQRRKRRALLFHGTFLLGLDLDRIERLLPMPTKQPAYRERRPHRDFVTNLPLSAATVKSALRQCWNASEPAGEIPFSEIERLVQSKYSQDTWSRRW